MNTPATSKTPDPNAAWPLAPPPLGLRPRWLVEELRIQEILEACTRYAQRSVAIPPEWLAELAELNQRARPQTTAVDPLDNTIKVPS